MKLIESVLVDLDREVENTRQILERVPEDKFDWKPHAKSFSLGALAAHVAMLPLFGAVVLERESLDFAAPGGVQWPAAPKSQKELLQLFEASTAKFRAALAAADDASLHATWTLRMGEKVLFSLPRMDVLRSSVMNHSIHHRAQLGVYLRLNDVPLPGLYGPSADEQ
jgi:uncharacterized damage-inducible protein DinB